MVLVATQTVKGSTYMQAAERRAGGSRFRVHGTVRAIGCFERTASSAPRSGKDGTIGDVKVRD